LYVPILADSFNVEKLHNFLLFQVCSFSGRKIGTLVCNTRRLEVVREGLREALTHGSIRSPLSNDFCGNTGTNHAAGAIKTVLSNICSKSNLLSPSGKIILPSVGLANKNHKVPILPTSQHTSSANITIPGALKAVLPKPQHMTVKTTVNSNVTCNKDTVKNGQFHVPNILSGSLKRHADSTKSSGNASSKRTKRKHTQNVNPAEIIGSLLARKNSRLGGRGSHVPLVTVAIANGLTGGIASSQSDTSESKNVLSSRGGVTSDSLRADLPKGLSASNINQISDGTTSATNMKGKVLVSNQFLLLRYEYVHRLTFFHMHIILLCIYTLLFCDSMQWYGTFIYGDKVKEFFKFRTWEKYLLFVVFPTVLSQYKPTIPSIFMSQPPTSRQTSHCMDLYFYICFQP
jgi:hypothetical protein